MWYHGVHGGTGSHQEDYDMDNVKMATLCTQSIILDMADEKGIDRGKLAKSIGEKDISRWGDQAVLTYEGFLRSCVVLGKGVNASVLFSMTKKRLTSGWKPEVGDTEKTESGLRKSRDRLGNGYVDVDKAGMDVSSALIMDWDAVLEAIAKGKHRDIEEVRGLFTKPPTKDAANKVTIHSLKHGEENEKLLTGLIRSGMAAAHIKGGESLEIDFPDQ